jgi:DNA polymerase
LDRLLSVKKTTDSRQKAAAGSTKISPADLAQLTHQTRNLLAFHLELGLSSYPAAAGLDQVFVHETPSLRPPGRGTPRQVATARSRHASASAGSPAKQTPHSSAAQLQVIGRNIAACRSCGRTAGVTIPGQGSPSPRLFVIGDCCTEPGEKGVIWGKTEDDLFWKMMAAIGLDRDSVYVTNCMKCSLQDSTLSRKERAGQCFTFLEQELMAVQPALICTMGEIAAGLLLKKDAPLARLRGRFHQYRYPHGGSARVMATFHPRFLLQQPEMKRATWMDLQAVQRQLQQSSG